MRSRARPEVYRGEGYDIRVIGAPRDGLRDAYHVFLRISWWGALGAIGLGYLALNAAFALLYLLVGGVAGAHPGSFLDAFFFSIQTMGTIGYGSMYPASRAANALVVAESLTSLVVMALATGLVFARFSRTRARVVFSSRAAIAPLDGLPTLMVRVGNERRQNNIVDAAFRLSLMRTERTAEGVTVYRTLDLRLVRELAPALSRSWMILHRIDPTSPLHGATPEQLAAADAELTLAVSGVDDTSLQPVHARHTWTAERVVFGARPADVISEAEDGALLMDLRRFDDLLPTTATPDFPYRAALKEAGP
jgi:inward rectifier potassium channel